MRDIDKLRDFIKSAWNIAQRKGYADMAAKLNDCLEEVEARRLGRYEETPDADRP